jgi:hypothetical protein
MLAWDELSPSQADAIPEQLAVTLADLFSEGYHIGQLCRHGHRYKGKEKSLRYNSSNGACVRCIAEHGQANPSTRRRPSRHKPG